MKSKDKRMDKMIQLTTYTNEAENKILKIHKHMSIFKRIVHAIGTPEDNTHLRNIMCQLYLKVLDLFEETANYLKMVKTRGFELTDTRTIYNLLVDEIDRSHEDAMCKIKKYTIFVDYISESAKLFMENILSEIE